MKILGRNLHRDKAITMNMFRANDQTALVVPSTEVAEHYLSLFPTDDEILLKRIFTFEDLVTKKDALKKFANVVVIGGDELLSLMLSSCKIKAMAI